MHLTKSANNLKLVKTHWKVHSDLWLARSKQHAENNSQSPVCGSDLPKYYIIINKTITKDYPKKI